MAVDGVAEWGSSLLTAGARGARGARPLFETFCLRRHQTTQSWSFGMYSCSYSSQALHVNGLKWLFCLTQPSWKTLWSVFRWSQYKGDPLQQISSKTAFRKSLNELAIQFLRYLTKRPVSLYTHTQVAGVVGVGCDPQLFELLLPICPCWLLSPDTNKAFSSTHLPLAAYFLFLAPLKSQWISSFARYSDQRVQHTTMQCQSHLYPLSEPIRSRVCYHLGDWKNIIKKQFLRLMVPQITTYIFKRFSLYKCSQWAFPDAALNFPNVPATKS